MERQNAHITHRAIRYLLCMLICVMAMASVSRAGPEDPEYDETSIYLMVQDIGGIEVTALINGENLYLPVADLFEFLKIRNTLSVNRDSVTGTFIRQEAAYLVDYTQQRILYEGKVFKLQPQDIIRTNSNLYLKLPYFDQVFGLSGKFNFRSLSATITSKVELPAIRERRLEEMRRNISRLKGELKADTSFGSKRPLFHFGMADWSVIATQRINSTNDTRVNLSLGGIVAGGETTVSLNYNNYYSSSNLPDIYKESGISHPFDERLQFYRWRYVNNDWKAVRQILAGKIYANSTSTIYAPIVGMQLTNTPSTFRRSYGSYTLSNYTNPGWTVELYINGILVDYTVADAAGFYTFQVPLVYGNTQVRLRFYSPWGEERSSEMLMNVPFNFLPAGTFEYTVSGGIVQDGHQTKFARTEGNYGVNRYLALGAGTEYLSSIVRDNHMPFVTASLRLANNLLLSGEYTHGVRGNGIFSYRHRSQLEVEARYTRYKRGQQAINFNYLEERRLTLARPFTTKTFSLFTRVMLNQIILPGTRYTTAEGMVSGALGGIGANFSTYGLFAKDQRPYVYSTLSLSIPVPSQRALITPQVQYEYNKSRVISIRCEIGKYIFYRGYLNLFYEQNYRSDINNIGLSLRYDLSFGQIAISALRGNRNSTLVQAVRGGFIYDAGTHFFTANNRINTGTGGIVLQPFLDLNSNGRWDKGEIKVSGIKVNINTGRIITDDRDTTVRILELTPYTTYYVDLGRSNFDNIAWKLAWSSMNVTIDPHRLKPIQVPVLVMGEVSGKVYLQTKDERKEMARVTVCFYRKNGSLAAKTLSQADGYFSFLGLAPGRYTARIDADQLQKLRLKAEPASIPFSIKPKMDGDIVEGLEFVLH
ncbi:hypothetical protein [Chitinophaga tropicalis]|uniref:Carboxypeptidase regulatory-like domain-containing protein n=1 Tax=Chitinophaga tropicalis TaxID=2683588 RepID=A0A7K1U0W5_9BACT|nr:hypothetical protein [Chitinophaga tropicalis]MVT07635.1 hypothetical protein [Chitinophaga tropicalis]